MSVALSGKADDEAMMGSTAPAEDPDVSRERISY